MKYNVYGISTWPENLDERFEIFLNKEFASEEDAIKAAWDMYNPTLDVEVEVA